MSIAARRIVTVTLNPALDLSTSVPEVAPGRKLRCAAPNEDPGGGGVNVSRAIRFLGGESLAMAALAGPTGARLLAHLQREGLAVVPLPAPGETRRSLSVISDADGAQYRFLLPGPDWDEAAVELGVSAARAAFMAGDLAVVSGSLPPGAPADLAWALGAAAVEKGAFALLDTSGPGLIAATAEREDGLGLPGLGMILRMDREEAESVAGAPIPDLKALADFAADLRARLGYEAVVAASGAEGSVMAWSEGRLHARPPKVEVVSKVGAGDSFVGAFAMTATRGETLAEALAVGVAAAAAAVTTPDTRLCTAQDVARLRPAVVMEPI